MQLADHLRQSGSRFFRWRSRLPWLVVPVFLVSLADSDYPSWVSPAADRWWSLGCLLPALVGLGLRLHASGTAPWGTSGRNTEAPLAEALTTTGLYSVVRHPMYLGNYLIGLGLSLLPYAWYLPLLFTLAFALYYERIVLVEEAFLEERFGDAFRRWADAVPAFVPRWSVYRPAALPWSWRAALRREFYGISVVAVTFGAAGASRSWPPPWGWAALAGGGAVFFLVMRTLKKRTAWLAVRGR